jgi:glycosyltransferase involved in cell wall biosynthesis
MSTDQYLNSPVVSIIVPTKNSASTLEACLKSIREQTYQNVELIVVDNFSTDATQEIAKKYADKVFEQGPERSAQVNYGVEQAIGEFVYKVDSDFVLDPQVVSQCMEEVVKGFDAIVVHNSPDVRVSWIAKIRKFEVDMYKYDITHSSARFVKREVYQKIGGFNSKITAGEDYDFQNKLNRSGYKTGFVEAEALHLGEPTNIWKHMKKYYDYGKDFVNYYSANKKESGEQLTPFRNVYAKNWKSFVRHPLKTVSFLAYTTFKYSFALTGFIMSSLNKPSNFRSYDAQFYSHQKSGSLNSAKRMVPLILEIVPVKSVVDVGCGTGTWLNAFIENGVASVQGIDGSHVNVEQLHISKDLFMPLDLEQPIHIGKKFDLAISLEVAEHISPENAVQFVKSLTDLAPTIVFSAAIPFQVARVT